MDELRAPRCPNCHAPVEVPGWGGVRCPYCGTAIERQHPIGRGGGGGGARPPEPPTLGGAALAAARRRARLVAGVAGALLLLGGVGLWCNFFFARYGVLGEQAIAAAVLFGAAALCATRVRRWLGLAIAVLGGAGIGLKPLVAPQWYGAFGSLPAGPFSLTSETHLYFLLPGAGLLGIAVVLFLRLPAGGKQQGAHRSA